jgi:hypothetical protein
MNGYLWVEQLIKSTTWRSWPSSENKWARKGRNCGGRNHGFCIKTMCQLTMPSRLSSFWLIKCIPVLHPPSPPFTGFSPLWLLPFPKLKSAFKGTHFQSVDEVKSKTADLLKRMSGDDLQHCFEQWKIHMQLCIDGGGGGGWEYAEGDRNYSVRFPDFSHKSRYFIATPHTLDLLVQLPL